MIMKKILACLLALMLVLGCTAIAEEAKPLAGKTLKIAMSPDFMYFETISETDPCGYEGLDIDIEVVKGLLDVDKALWKEDAAGIEEFYKKFGDRLPKELKAELETLKKNLD